MHGVALLRSGTRSAAGARCALATAVTAGAIAAMRRSMRPSLPPSTLPPFSSSAARRTRRSAWLSLGAVALLALACSSDDDEPGSGGGGTGGGDAANAPCPEGSLFCDGFEEAALGPLAMPWRTSAQSATVAVDEVQAFSGTQAVHVNAPQPGGYHRGYFGLDEGSSAGIFPAVATEMYGRVMVYLPVLPNASVHWTFIQAEGRAADDTHDALYRFGGQHQNGAQLMANYETANFPTTMPVRSDCWDHSATLLPVAEWACVEWRFAVATNEMQLWLDGTELTDIHVTGSGEGCIANDLNGQWTAPPAFQTLYLGWEHYQQAANPIDLWVDDVVVDTKRVGCPAPQ